MNLGIFCKFKFIKKLFKESVGYYSDDIYELTDNGLKLSSEHRPKLLIVSAKHCETTQKSYPSISRKELLSILKLERNASDSPIIFNISKNIEEEGFNVITTSFIGLDADKCESSLIFIPEAELIGLSSKNCCLNIETPAGHLYHYANENNNFSAFKNQLLKTEEQFRLSIGIGEADNSNTIVKSQYALLLLEYLETASFENLYKRMHIELNSLIDAKKLHMLYFAPLISISLLYLGIYGYTSYELDSVEKKLQSYGDEVNVLLERKLAIDDGNNYLNIINENIVETPLVHGDWVLVHKATEGGMELQQFTKREGVISMRGVSDNASNALKVIAGLDIVESAEFDGPVRKSRKRDYARIKVILKSQ